ncbi:MAG: succinylglutamate desuccinylase/aspartoacylase family protein, partial [Myxococcota bacterium]|nr:succinylglutamate desuccinylase/aspartoacylase family protein [Myxococcota bacterium]
GGIHGDEIAGVQALETMLDQGRLRPSAGRLLVIPLMNPPAYRAGHRCRPGGLDLNRCFPGDPDAEQAEFRLAHRFMRLIRDERPDLVATLHESTKRYDPSVDTPTFGQTLVYGVKPAPPLLEQVLVRLNARIQHPDERWDLQYFPVDTSSTEVIVAAIGCVGTCVETWMGFDLTRRVELQIEVVRQLLHGLGIMPYTET